MTARRCPNCGALVGRDAEWCTQCFARLDQAAKEPAPAPRPRAPTPRPEVPAARDRPQGAGVRATAEGILWACPTCGSENPIEAMTCKACGAPFGRVFEDREPRPQVDPGRVLAYSLLFPGLGHIAAGRWADGLARAVIFAYALATAITILVSTGARPGPLSFLLVASVAVAAALYAVSAADAPRAARAEPPLLGARLLLYGGAGLILLTVIVMVIVGGRVAGVSG